MKRKLLLFSSLVLLFVLPLIGGSYKWKDLPSGTRPIIGPNGDTIGTYFQWKGRPPGYGDFPAQKVSEDAPFNATYFAVASVFCVFILIFFLFPKWFGFKKPPVPATKKRWPLIRPGLYHRWWYLPSVGFLCGEDSVWFSLLTIIPSCHCGGVLFFCLMP